MAQDMAATILTDKVAQVRSETHIRDGGLLQAPFLDGHAFQKNEALPVEEVLAEDGG